VQDDGETRARPAEGRTADRSVRPRYGGAPPASRSYQCRSYWAWP